MKWWMQEKNPGLEVKKKYLDFIRGKLKLYDCFLKR